MQRRITIALTPDDYNFLAQSDDVGKFVADAVKKAIEEKRADKKEPKKVRVSILGIN